MTMRELSVRAGLHNVNPKQYIHGIESAKQSRGVRMGTLYALAHALGLNPSDLLPTTDEVLVLASVDADGLSVLSARP
jgi:hypothetical protein